MTRRHGKPIDMARLKTLSRAALRGQVDRVAGLADHLRAGGEPIDQDCCYVCAGTARTPFARVHGIDYVRCAGCGHVYTTVRYPDAAIQAYYRDNPAYAATYADPETCFYRRDAVALPKVVYAEEESGLSGGRWLDVGCGIGDMVSAAGDRGWQATGLEISRTSVAFARDTFGVELVAETLDDFAAAYDGPPFDIVSFIGVLEHLVDPLAALRLAHGLLDAGGFVYIQVPNAESLSTQVQQVFPDYVFRHMSPNEHIMLFSEPSLRRALAETGFEGVALWFHGQDVFELLSTLIMAHPAVEGSALAGSLLDGLNELQQVFDDRALSDRLICLARRL